jgi:hypothetical protein
MAEEVLMEIQREEAAEPKHKNSSLFGSLSGVEEAIYRDLARAWEGGFHPTRRKSLHQAES